MRLGKRVIDAKGSVGGWLGNQGLQSMGLSNKKNKKPKIAPTHSKSQAATGYFGLNFGLRILRFCLFCILVAFSLSQFHSLNENTP